ncbi:hypothetical protein [Rhodoferax sp. WC2427]
MEQPPKLIDARIFAGASMALRETPMAARHLVPALFENAAQALAGHG